MSTERASRVEAGGAGSRSAVTAQALRLEYFTVGWNLVEGGISIAAALAAGSVVLLGFGVDSFVESFSGTVLIWRFLAERKVADARGIETLDRRARKLVAFSLFGLAVYVALDALYALGTVEEPGPSALGIAVTIASIGVMWCLALAKRRTAARLGSGALAADAVQTTACWWLSIITLAGVGLNTTLGWWWADPVAALGMTFFLVREGRKAWRGDDCCP